MKKILNLFLLAVVALALAGTGCTAKMKKAWHESRADKFYAKGEFDKAEIEYLRVLRDDNENAKAFSRLSEIYYQQGRYQLALPFLGRAMTLATNDVEIRIKLAKVLAGGGRWNDLREQAQFIITHSPQSPEGPVLLAQSAQSKKEITAVREQIQKLMKSGDRAAYEVALGTLAYREGDAKAADAAFKRALALDAKSAEAQESMGALLLAQGEAKAAEPFLKAASDLSEDRSAQRMIYARYKMQADDLPGARKILEDVAAKSPDFIPCQMGLAEIALMEKKSDEANKIVGKVLARDPDNFDGLLLQSRLKYLEKDLAGCVQVLERMSKIYSLMARVHFQLGAAYAQSGDETKAVLSLNRALELESGLPEAVMLLAQIQIHNQDPEPAIASLGKLVQTQPKLVQAQLLLADAYRLRNRLDEALAIYSAMEKIAPADPQIPLLAGSAFTQLKEYDQARKALDRALKAAPDSLPAIGSMVDLDIAEKKFDAALQLVQSHLATTPNSLPLTLLVAKVQLAQERRDLAEQTLLKAVSLDPNAEGPCLLLAQLYFDIGQKDKARAQLESAISRNKENLSAMMLLGTMNESDKNWTAAVATYEKMIKQNPQCSPALNNAAYIYSEYLNQPDRAYDLAQQARQLLPFDPSTADTLGWICWKRGSYSAALGLLQESVQKLGDQPEIRFHLGLANYMAGRETEARAALQRALALKKDFRGNEEAQLYLTLLDIQPATATAGDREKLEQHISQKTDDFIALGKLAEIYQRSGNTDKAIVTYDSLLKSDGKNAAAALNLARLWSGKDNTKAYQFGKTALKLAPGSADAMHICGALAYQNADYKLAESLLQNALQKNSDDALLQYNYARAAYSLGKVSAAQSALTAAAAGNLPANARAEAKRLADFIALSENPVAAGNAATQIADVLKSEPDYVPALVALAKAKEQAGDSAAAAAACEKALAKFPEFAPAERELAILFSTDKTKTQSAYTHAMKARDSYPNDLPLARATALIIFQQGEFSRAAGLLADCAAKSPNDAEIFYYLGAAQLKLNQPAKAKATLQQALNLKLAGPLADSARQLLAGVK